MVGKPFDVEVGSRRRILRLDTAIRCEYIDQFRFLIPHGLSHCRRELAAGLASCGRFIDGSLLRLSSHPNCRPAELARVPRRLEGSALLFQPRDRQCRALLASAIDRSYSLCTDRHTGSWRDAEQVEGLLNGFLTFNATECVSCRLSPTMAGPVLEQSPIDGLQNKGLRTEMCWPSRKLIPPVDQWSYDKVKYIYRRRD